MLKMRSSVALGAVAVVAPSLSAATFSTLPAGVYNQASASPFFGPDLVIEDFEDGALNTPGIVDDSGGLIVPPQFAADSVDGDDGVIDGSGQAGYSWDDRGKDIVRFSFDAGIIGAAPKRAGIVWTDAGNAGITLTFEAFDTLGNSLGTVVDQFDDTNGFTGATDDDRFYGIEHLGGIGAIEIRVSSNVNVFEVDHVQYSLIPSPGAAGLLSVAVLAGARRRR